jgi:Ca2+/Na+ antiporter
LYPSASAVLTYFLIVISLLRDDLMIISLLLLLLLLTLFPFFRKRKRKEKERKERKKERGFETRGRKKKQKSPSFSLETSGWKPSRERTREEESGHSREEVLVTNEWILFWMGFNPPRTKRARRMRARKMHTATILPCKSPSFRGGKDKIL